MRIKDAQRLFRSCQAVVHYFGATTQQPTAATCRLNIIVLRTAYGMLERERREVKLQSEIVYQWPARRLCRLAQLASAPEILTPQQPCVGWVCQVRHSSIIASPGGLRHARQLRGEDKVRRRGIGLP